MQLLLCIHSVVKQCKRMEQPVPHHLTCPTPTQILIKTCGTTSLLNCIVKLMHHAKTVGAEPDFLQFSRSNFLFPQLQPFPHRNFDMETQYLNTLFQGQAYILGPINGERHTHSVVSMTCIHACAIHAAVDVTQLCVCMYRSPLASLHRGFQSYRCQGI